MTFVRMILSVVFWLIALVIAVPPICKLQPLVEAVISNWREHGAASWSTDLAQLVDYSGNAILWLILSGVCIGVALLPRPIVKKKVR